MGIGIGVGIGVLGGLLAGGILWYRRVRVGDAYEPIPLRDAGSAGGTTPPHEDGRREHPPS